MIRLVAIAVLASGCQLVFPAQELDSGLGDGGFDVPVDVPVDLPITIDDRDGDGVDNPNDNCPDTSNSDQHDEDVDTVGDACDICPHINGAITNADGDHLGDDCDPSPEPDCIVLFDGFATLNNWTVISGNWTVMSDAALQTEPATQDTLLVSKATFANTQILVGGTLFALGSTSSSVGIASSVQLTTPPTGLIAEVQQNSMLGRAEIALLQATVGGINLISDDQLTPQESLGATKSFAVDLVKLTGNVQRTSGRVESSGANTQISRLDPAGRIGLRTSTAAATFAFVLVSERRTSACPSR